MGAIDRARLRVIEGRAKPLDPKELSDIAVLSSGIEALDGLLPHGGIPRGRLTQLSGRRSSGKRALAAALCTRALEQGQRVAWIDGGGGFYPLPSLEHGAPLDRLLVVRLPHPRQRLRAVLKATDMLLQAAGALALIVVDLPPLREGAFPAARPRNPWLSGGRASDPRPSHRPAAHRRALGSLPQSQLARLRFGAERSGTAVVFISEKGAPVVASASLGTFICLHLAVTRAVGCHGRCGDLRVAIVKSKLGRMACQTEVEIDEPHGVHLDTTV